MVDFSFYMRPLHLWLKPCPCQRRAFCPKFERARSQGGCTSVWRFHSNNVCYSGENSDLLTLHTLLEHLCPKNVPKRSASDNFYETHQHSFRDRYKKSSVQRQFL